MTARISARNSSAQSSSVAAATGTSTGQRARALVAAELDAGVVERPQRAGQERLGHGGVDEQALGRVAHAGRWTLPLSAIASASSRSAESSTTTWQLPEAAKMTGTVATPLSAAFRPSPPRGMIRSTTPAWVASSASSSRPPPATSDIEPAGRPAPSAARAAIAASTALEWAAEDEPRRTIALPDFRHRAAASIVTFGRAS